ncbi:hypothetical protein Sste5346_005297 [Sporothrix stenoceras]|uniref:Uncharacterized protein n=1 Tax=Sporothrix stenoceras TaxID=5173 RepID=A0ABR3Z7H9_9PEZI
MHLTSGAILALSLAGRATATAIAVEPRATTTASFPGPWVTIDGAGHVSTVTPSLSGKSTVSAPPTALTKPTPYILSINGHATTTTASPPVASATGPGTAGAFMACSSGQDAATDQKATFCQPRAGTQIATNHTYFVVWDPSSFSVNSNVEILGAYGNGQGFTSEPLEAHSGFYAWTVPSSLVAAHGDSAGHVNVTFALAYNASTIPDAAAASNGTIELLKLQGPSVLVTNTVVLPHTKHHHRVAAVAIAVPVVVGAAVLCLLGFCVWSYRHHGHLPCIGGLVSRRTSSFSAKGYGVRQSYGQRTGSTGQAGTYGPGLHNNVFAPPPPDSSYGPASTGPISATPTGRSNAFRDELKRQEDARR